MTDELPPLKRCSKCKEHKPHEAFSKSRGSKDGYNYCCKACQHAYYAANAEAIRARTNAYYYNNIEQIREYRSANADTILEKMRAYYRANKESFRKRKKAWRAQNAEHLSEYNREYLADHRDEIMEQMRERRRANPLVHRNSNHKYRARKKGNGGSVTRQELDALSLAQAGVCAYCKFQHRPDDLTIDHIIPLDQGGPHEIKNICFACGVCNFNKSNRTPEQWTDRWYLRAPSQKVNRKRKSKKRPDAGV